MGYVALPEVRAYKAPVLNQGLENVVVDSESLRHSYARLFICQPFLPAQLWQEPDVLADIADLNTKEATRQLHV